MCPECERLIRTYGDALREARSRGEALSRHRATQENFRLLWEELERARRQYEALRGQLSKHLLGHSHATPPTK
jgi:hypothetical protein